MHTYRTMTVGGITGNVYEAPDHETAERHALDIDGYEVLDVVEDTSGEADFILVVPG